MGEIQRLWCLLRKRGLIHYLMRPQHFVAYGRYLVGMMRERWPERHSAIYVLEMPIIPQEAISTISTRCISSVEPLLAFAREREREDPLWHGKSYVAELEQRFARGDRCIAAEKDGRIVSVLFATFYQTKLEKVDYLLSFPSGVFGIVDAYTLSEFRGRRLYEAAFRACVNSFCEVKSQTIYGFIPPDNLISLRTHERLGLRHIILEVSMKQRWGIRRHVLRPMDMDIAELPQLRLPKIGSAGSHVF